MSDSMITQCPNCATTFRVSDEVLRMAKGKVRCGQCFHIFAAQPHENNNVSKRTSVSNSTNETPSKPKQPVERQSPANVVAKTSQYGEAPNPPDWLTTLIAAEQKVLDKQNAESLTPYQQRVLTEHQQQKSLAEIAANQLKEEQEEKLAPWERDLAELQALQNLDTYKKPEIKQKQTKEQLAPIIKKINAPTALREYHQDSATEAQPEYMHALHELTHPNTNPTGATGQPQYQKDAQQKLHELIEEDKTELADVPKRKKHTFFWFSTSIMAIGLLLLQVAAFNFEQGSRSATFRPVYTILCTYYGCKLPIFEDVASIDIQYVRVQSHPTQSNALLVNAIITNTSSFSQPMPKIALEFFDLNGNPIASRLFSQNNFLDKDFLDITYMPPSTPIHLVIAIADPGAAAVTHKLTAYPANTRTF